MLRFYSLPILLLVIIPYVHQTSAIVKYEFELCSAAGQTATETVTILDPIDLHSYIAYQTMIFTTTLTP